MGVSLEVYRCRIGLHNFRGGTGISYMPDSPSVGIIALKHVPAAVLCILILIAGVEPNPGPEHICKLCYQKFPTIAQFCEHSKLHQSSKNFSILCGFPNCQLRVKSVASYKVHVSRTHSRQIVKIAPGSSSSTDLECPVNTCVKKLSEVIYKKHMELHLKQGDTFQCIFEDCSTKFSTVPQFRTHMSRYHRRMDVNEVDTAAGQSEDFEKDESGGGEDNFGTETSDTEPSSNPTDLYPDSVIKDELAKFYLKLEAVYLLPSNTVQAIADEIKVLSELSHFKLKKSLEEELGSLNIDKNVIASVVSNTFKCDTIFNVHHKHEDVEQLGTKFTRLQYWEKNYPFVRPQEINLGLDDLGKSRKAHFISIVESLNVLLKDPKVKQLVKESFKIDSSENSQVLSDYTDGSAFRDHRSQHEGPCLQLLMFQDAFEFNPFGPSSGVYKPVGFYFTLGNIPAMYRSKVDLIQLVYMVLEKDLKATEDEELRDVDKMKKALKPLLDELRHLKVNGIELDGQKVPVCLLFSLGDSLGQNTIGGFVKNFSSEFSWRFCPMSKSEFVETPYQTKPLRTAEEYNNYVKLARKKMDKTAERWTCSKKEGIGAGKATC